MELENKDILERNVSEKMCSSGSNGAGEICSPGTADTCGVRDVVAEEQPKMETGLLCEIELRYGRLLQNQGCRRGHRD